MLTGACCDDEEEHLKQKLARQEELLEAERKRSVAAATERRQIANRARAECDQLQKRMQAETARRYWSDIFALIIGTGFCLSVLYLWRQKLKVRHDASHSPAHPPDNHHFP